METASQSFAADAQSFKHALGRIAADGGEGWKDRIPYDDTIRTILPKNRDLTCRKHSNEEAAKIEAENERVVQTFSQNWRN